jgi:2-C-methyl-D-erythritol 4-phosphate cytidylyltransferase
VARALESLPAEVDFVLVHDAARAFVPVGVIERVIAALRAGSLAVVPVIPVTDTVKLIDVDFHVVGTPARDALRAVQTPQGFRLDILESAHAMAEGEATDDATLAERAGVRVDTVAGDALAFKVTRPLDLLMAEALVAAEADQRGHS